MKRKLNTITASALAVVIATSGGAWAQSASDFLEPTAPEGMTFETSTEHFEWLKANANGGEGPTVHTLESIPQWRGHWNRAGNNNNDFFNTVENAAQYLTPEYLEAFEDRRSQTQQYDRLTHCEHPGLPRWFREPYTREFVNTPWQTWQLNDFMDEIRRIYILDYQGNEAGHVNVEGGTHAPMGDSIGFWEEDRLIIHTVDITPGDYFRNQPLTSNQFELVEIWSPVYDDDGEIERLNVNMRAYDPLSLLEPIDLIYSFTTYTDLNEQNHRIRQWECAISSNSYLAEDGTTQFRLPGEPGYRDIRGPMWSAYPDLPGQSRDPDWVSEDDLFTQFGLN